MWVAASASEDDRGEESSCVRSEEGNVEREKRAGGAMEIETEYVYRLQRSNREYNNSARPTIEATASPCSGCRANTRATTSENVDVLLLLVDERGGVESNA